MPFSTPVPLNTEEDLRREMGRWIRGEMDWFDQIIRFVKRKMVTTKTGHHDLPLSELDVDRLSRVTYPARGDLMSDDQGLSTTSVQVRIEPTWVVER